MDAQGKRFMRMHKFRHSYLTLRIQTLDRGKSVALVNVAKEVSHPSTDMLEERYGHLQEDDDSRRTDYVEFRLRRQRGAPNSATDAPDSAEKMHAV